MCTLSCGKLKGGSSGEPCSECHQMMKSYGTSTPRKSFNLWGTINMHTQEQNQNAQKSIWVARMTWNNSACYVSGPEASFKAVFLYPSHLRRRTVCSAGGRMAKTSPKGPHIKSLNRNNHVSGRFFWLTTVGLLDNRQNSF